MANKVKIPRTPKPQVTEEVVNVVVEESVATKVKHVFESKTIWVNLLAFIAFAIEKKYGFVIDQDLQLQALTLINIVLRFVTKDPIAWGGSK